MTKSEMINAIINGFTAIGTITVAILAIWGNSIRTRFFGPNLSLVPHNFKSSSRTAFRNWHACNFL